MYAIEGTMWSCLVNKQQFYAQSVFLTVSFGSNGQFKCISFLINFFFHYVNPELFNLYFLAYGPVPACRC